MAAAEQLKLRKRLEALLKLPENQICCDCKKRGPRWASVTLGVFMCIDCSGIHRNLGVHISFVRSVNLDSWTGAQVDFIEEWGNGRANLYYEGNMPSHIARPKDGDSVRVIEKFIRDKYEHKRYIAKAVPPKVQNSDENGESNDKNGRKAAVTRQRPPPSNSEHGEAPPIPVKAAPAPAPAPSLIDFMDFSEEPVVAAVPVVPTHAPPAVPGFMPSYVGFIDFGDFSSPVPAQTSEVEPDSSSFSRFTSDETPVVPAVPTRPTRSADAILSLFESAPPPPVVNAMTGMSSVTTSADGISSMGGMAPAAYGMNGGRVMMPQGGMPIYGQPHPQQMPMQMQMQQGHYPPQMPVQMPMSMPMQQMNGMGQQQQFHQQQYPQQYMQQQQQHQQQQQQQQQQQYQQYQQQQYQQQQQQQQHQQQPQMRGMSAASSGPGGFQQQYTEPQHFNFGN